MVLTRKRRALSGGRCKAPESADPGLGEIALDLEELRIVAPELLTDPVHEPGSVAGQVVRDARPLAQLDDLRRGRVQAPERVAVGSQRIAERTGIAAVVLGAGRREAVPEPVQLLRVERMDREAPFHQGLHHGPMRDLDGDPDGVCLGVRCGDEPVRHLRETGSAVPEGTFSQDRAFAIDDADVGFDFGPGPRVSIWARGIKPAAS